MKEHNKMITSQQLVVLSAGEGVAYYVHSSVCPLVATNYSHKLNL